MCRLFVSADPHLYEVRARSLRLHGAATSLRLENLFWQVLDEIAARDGLSLNQLITRLHDELLESGADLSKAGNFTSFLRVCCGRYLALQASGHIPTDPAVPIRSLDATAVLAAERALRNSAPSPARAAA